MEPAAPATPASPQRGKHIALLYSSNQLADYEPCGCPVHPLGGVARRATLIDRAAAEADAVVSVDAGNLFLPLPARVRGAPAGAPGEVERRGRMLAAAFGRTGLAAFLPGERDLALGLPLLRRLARAGGLPIVATNLKGRDGKPLFAVDRLIPAAGVTIGIAGVTAPPTPEDRQAWRAAGIDAGDPAAALRDAAASLRARGAQLVVALVHVGERADVRKLLDAAPGVDWAVVGHGNMRFDTPEEAGGARLLQGLGNGKELGRLDLHVVGGGVRFADGGERAQLETILADHRRQLADYDRRLAETDPSRVRDFFVSRRAAIEKAIATEEALLARLPTAVSGSWFENRLLPLDAATPDQTGVALLVDAYNRESVRRAAAGKPVGLVTDSARPGGRRRRGRGRRAGEPGRSRREGGAAPRLPRRRRLRDVPRAGARVLEDDEARPSARLAGARRARSGSRLRRLPRHRIPARRRHPGHRRGAATAGERGLRGLSWAGAGARRGRPGRQAIVDRARGPGAGLPRVPHR